MGRRKSPLPENITPTDISLTQETERKSTRTPTKETTTRGTKRQRKQYIHEKPAKKGGNKKDIPQMIKNVVKQKPGPPSDYEKKYHPAMAYQLCSIYGCTYEQLAKSFGVEYIALWRWRKDHPELDKAITQGLDDFNVSTIENKIVQVAKGYEYPERTYENFPVRDPETKEIVRWELRLVKETWKHVQPNAQMLQFYAINRISHRWANLQQLQVRGAIAHVGVGRDAGIVPLDPTKLDDATLDAVLLSLGMDGPPRLVDSSSEEIEEAVLVGEDEEE